MGRYKTSVRRLEISGRQKQSSPGGSGGKCWNDMLQNAHEYEVEELFSWGGISVIFFFLSVNFTH